MSSYSETCPCGATITVTDDPPDTLGLRYRSDEFRADHALCRIAASKKDSGVAAPDGPMSEQPIQPAARRRVLTEAWTAVDRAITPLGYGGGATNSPWNKGYEQAKNEALNAILALRTAAEPAANETADQRIAPPPGGSS